MRKFLAILAITALLLIAVRFFYASVTKYFVSKKMGIKKIPQVTVEIVSEKNILSIYEVPGRVDASTEIDIVTRVSGYLQKSFFKEGDFVKKGQLLFLIEETQYRNSANSILGDVQSIKARLSFAQRQLERASELVKKDFISKARYDELKSQRDSYAAQLKSSESQYKDAVRNLSYTRIKSPIDGKIGKLNISVGNYVTPSTSPLTTINSTNPIYVEYALTSDDYINLNNIDGDNPTPRKTEIYFPNGTKYEYDGVQDFSDNKIDESTGTVLMRSSFKNPKDKLIDGEFVNVKLYSNNYAKIPSVSVSAVQENQEGKYVYIVDDKNIAHVSYITVRSQSDNKYYVSKGISTGDKVITSGIMNVIPEGEVKIVQK